MLSRKPIFLLMLVAVFIAIAGLSACQSDSGTEPLPGAGAGVTPEQVAQVEEQLQQSRQDLTVLPADDPGRIAAEKKINELEKLVAAYKLNREDQAANGSGDPEASIAAGVQTVAPFLPPPWNAVLLIVGGLIPGVAGWIREIVRRQQAERAGEDLARAIKATAVANGGVLDFTDLNVRESLKSAMPDDARDIVKSAGANVPLPFVVEAPADTGAPVAAAA